MWLLSILVTTTVSSLGSQAPSSEPPRRSIGAAAYPEFVKLSRFFVARSLAEVPRSYRIAAKFTGADSPASPFFIRQSSAMSLVHDATCEAELVAFAVPRESVPFLGADDRWVFSEHVLEAVEVMRHTGAGGALPKSIRLIYPVGDLQISGRRASTEVSRYPRLRAGQKYLFFLRRTEDGSWFRTVNRLPLMRVSSPMRVAPVSADYDPALFAGRTASELTGWIRAADCSR
jgi:hypothetical protein